MNVPAIIAVLGSALVLAPDVSGALVLIWWEAVIHRPKALVVAVGAVVAAGILLRRSHRYRFSGLVGAGFGVCFLSGALSALVFRVHPGKALPALALDVVAFVLAAWGTRDRDEHPLLVLVTATASMVSGLAILEALGLTLPWTFSSRPVSTLGARTSVAAYAGMALPLSVLLAARSRHWIVLVPPPLLLVATLGFRVKSAWIGLAAMVVCGLALRVSFFSKRVAWSLLPALLALAVVPWPGLKWNEPSVVPEISDIANPHSRSGAFRTGQYLTGFSMLRDYPLLGVGPGNWSTIEPKYRLEATPKGWMHVSPHSDLVRIFTERGLIGGIAFLVLILGVAMEICFVIARPRAAWSEATFAHGAALSLTFILANGLFFYPLARPEILAVMALLVGAVSSRQREPVPASRAWKSLLSTGAIAAMLIFFLQNLAVLPLRNGFGVDTLKKAQSIFPHPYFAIFLGWSAIQEGRCPEVMASIESAAAWEPNRPEAREYLDKCATQ